MNISTRYFDLWTNWLPESGYTKRGLFLRLGRAPSGSRHCGEFYGLCDICDSATHSASQCPYQFEEGVF